jgi:hypothetical protein
MKSNLIKTTTLLISGTCFLINCGGGGDVSPPPTATNQVASTATQSVTTSLTKDAPPPTASSVPGEGKKYVWDGQTGKTTGFKVQEIAKNLLVTSNNLLNVATPGIPSEYFDLIEGTFNSKTGQQDNASRIAMVGAGIGSTVNVLATRPAIYKSIPYLTSKTYCLGVLFTDYRNAENSLIFSAGADDCTTYSNLKVQLQPINAQSSPVLVPLSDSVLSPLWANDGAITGFLLKSGLQLYKTDKNLGTRQPVSGGALAATSTIASVVPLFNEKGPLVNLNGVFKVFDATNNKFGSSMGTVPSGTVVQYLKDSSNVYLLYDSLDPITVAGLADQIHVYSVLKIPLDESKPASYLIQDQKGLAKYMTLTKNRVIVVSSSAVVSCQPQCGTDISGVQSIDKAAITPANFKYFSNSANAQVFSSIVANSSSERILLGTAPQTIQTNSSTANQSALNKIYSSFSAPPSNANFLDLQTTEMNELLEAQTISRGRLIVGSTASTAGLGHGSSRSHAVVLDVALAGGITAVRSYDLLTGTWLRLDGNTAPALASSLQSFGFSSVSYSGFDYGTSLILQAQGATGTILTTKYVDVLTQGSLR